MKGNSKMASTRPAFRYFCPSGANVRVFAMRELDAMDLLIAAANADKFGPPEAKENMAVAFRTERREAQRLSLIEVDGKRVNVNGERYSALDTGPKRWNVKALQCLDLAYNQVNQVEENEAKGFLAGRVLVAETDLAPLDPEDSEEHSSPSS